VIDMQYKVRRERHPGQLLAVVRRRARRQDLATVVPEACGTVWNVLRARHVTEVGRHVAVYWDDAINLEVGVELGAPFSGFGDVVCSTTPAGPVATSTHFGPYEGLHAAHDAICAWCATSGQALAGPFWEVYGHWKDEWINDPSRIITDVYYLLDADGNSAS
jgi:effector-binding domain-containing protein